jgi:hypothetical protein
MYVIIKVDVGYEIHSNIVSVCDTFKQALNECNNYMSSQHNETSDVIYRDCKNRFSHYSRGLIYGRTLKTIYELINHQEKENHCHQDQQYEEIFLNCPFCHENQTDIDEEQPPLSL